MQFSAPTIQVFAGENILISLPDYVSRCFLDTWLEVRDICILDNAFCSRTQRTIFLRILGKCITPFEKSCYKSYCKQINMHTELYLKWIARRNLPIRNLSIYNWNELVLARFLNSNLFVESLVFYFNERRFSVFNEEILLELFNSKIFKNLTELGLGLMNIITDATLVSIADNCNDLKIIDLSHCERITENGLIKIAKKCLKLEVMNISFNYMSDFCFREISINCKNLKSINLDFCNLRKDSSVIEIFKNCLKLENVSLSHNIEINDKHLIAISINCSSLKKLDVSFCSGNITDNGVIAISEHCVQLQTLIFTHNKNISDASLNAISKTLLSLETLKLCGCVNIKDTGTIAIAEKCLKLKNFSLCENKNVTDLTLKAISKKLLNIQNLDLTGCDRISDNGVIIIAENGLKFVELYLSENERITDRQYLFI
jgi:hypothetical protein